MPDYRIIDSVEELQATVEALSRTERYALDTEFHREQSYWPKVALVQIAWDDRIVLIDPLAVDLEPLKALMACDALAVIHAARQDLEILDLACGAIPARLFDTQIAAGFLGLSTPSLAFLHERELGVTLAKGSRFTDWLKRPLGASQLEYAASDVARLLELHDRLVSKLNDRGRLSWVQAECELMRSRDLAPRDPDEAWSRIKEARHLKGRPLAVGPVGRRMAWSVVPQLSTSRFDSFFRTWRWRPSPRRCPRARTSWPGSAASTVEWSRAGGVLSCSRQSQKVSSPAGAHPEARNATPTPGTIARQ